MQGISLLAANRLASQEGLWSMEYFFSQKPFVSRKAYGTKANFRFCEFFLISTF